MGESAEAEAIQSLPVGAEIGGYAILRILGHGGFGITYEARNPVTGWNVAIKEFFPSSLARRDGQSRLIYARANAEMVTWALGKFKETTTTLCRLKHPNIVKVHDYLPANDTGYMVMELLDGQTLHEWLRARPAKPGLAELHPILDPIMEALGYVHESGLVHRDIAPDNILITRDGRPVLIDFGSSSRDLSAQHSHFGGTIGVQKRNYTAPEQMRAKARPTPQADVYSMGAVLYRALTGAEPADGQERIDALFSDRRADPFKPLMSCCPENCTPRAARAIDEALAVRPEQRLRAIADLRAAVKPPPVQASAPRRLPVAALVLGGMAIAGLGIGAGVAMDRWSGVTAGTNAQADVDRERRDIAADKADLDRQRDGLATLKADLDRQGNEVRAAKADIDRKREDMASASADVDKQKSEVEADRAAVERDRKDVAAARADSDKQRDDAQAARADVDRERADVASAKADLDKQRDELQVARAAVDEGRKANAAAKSDIDRQAHGLDAAKPSAPLSARALFNLGWLAYKVQDYSNAREWYEKAAAGGDTNAMFNLGLLYQNGQGVDRDVGKAREWYEKGVDGGNALAMVGLGVIYDHALGVARDDDKANELYQQAAAIGNSTAMYNLGAKYEGGRGYTKNLRTARDWYEKAARAGDTDAPAAIRRLDAQNPSNARCALLPYTSGCSQH